MRSLDDAIATVVEALCARQREDGSWHFQCEFDPSLTALFILLRHSLGWQDEALDAEMVRYLRHEELADGGWGGSPDSGPSLDITVLCYAALRAAGVPTGDKALASARGVIRDLGGLGGIGIIPRLILWALGQIPRRALPYVSPRLINLPRWMHLDRLGMLALGVVPFSLLDDERVRCLPEDYGIAELEPQNVCWRSNPRHKLAPPLSGGRFWLVAGKRVLWVWLDLMGRVLHAVDHIFPPLRARTVVREWILDHQGTDGTFGEGLAPSLINFLALAGHCGEQIPQSVDRGMQTLLSWAVSDERGTWMPFALSTTHDTARVIEVLRDFSVARVPVEAGVRWLQAHQAGKPGFWCVPINHRTRPGGWAFGRENPWLVDTDDTAIVLNSVRGLPSMDHDAWQRGLDWLLAMQGRDGGWAGFTCDFGPIRTLFATLTDPGVAASLEGDDDITARVLILLGPLQNRAEDPGGCVGSAVASGVRFLWMRRQLDGTWTGRWWVNRVYGTAQVIEALVVCGQGDDPRIVESARWLESVRNPDGGWGESKRGYHTGRFEPGPSNPLATAFAVRALIASGFTNGGILRAAVDFLLAAQEQNGLWVDPGWNGVFLPGASYIRYEPSAFVLGALSMARDHFQRAEKND
ncbi:MAG: hypothetical protein KA152_02385 [Verrucomicrobiales bacterium]|nr:hypothetical protein [Verrucomicrobiales bacterium]